MPRGGAREGAGRPPKPESEKGRLTKAVSISLYEEERDQLDAICTRMGLTRSDFVRLAMRHAEALAGYQRMEEEIETLRQKVDG